MPELPEVETTRQGIHEHIVGQSIKEFSYSGLSLRKPFVLQDTQAMLGHRITDVKRRGKYLILTTTHPSLDLLIHLGMSGSLRVITSAQPRKKHDHVVMHLTGNIELRYHDPRRFGFVMAFAREHPPKEITHLGVEPLSEALTATYLYQHTKGKQRAIKDLIMDQKIIVGVGNIYATEALFLSQIFPSMPAQSLSFNQSELLTQAIKDVLALAIKAGGTTLRDFVQSDGQPGYFKQTLQVYGRVGEPCKRCEDTIVSSVIGGRNSAYCPSCQALRKP